MIKREVLQDIKSYEVKLIGPLTARMAIWVGLGAIVAVPVAFAAIALGAPVPVAIIAGGVIFAPLGSLGIIKVYDMPITKFAGQFLYTHVLPPKERIYMTENTIEKAIREMKEDEFDEAEAKEKEKSRIKARKSLLKNPEYKPLP